MPLPPLPDPAVIDGPGHIADSQKLTAYLRALAHQDEVEIELPDPDPGHAGHVEWHNAMVKAARKVADAIGATVNLPPDAVKAKDLEHVTHHNLLAKALADMAAAVPFSVSGGQVWTGSGWKAHIFFNNGTLTVKGSGRVTVLVVGGGGGSGYWKYVDTFAQYYAGTGGGGTVAGIASGGGDTPLPTEQVTSGSYAVTVGRGGADSPGQFQPGTNGGESSLIGGSVSLSAPGGGGGGSADVPGQSAGTGGGAGVFFDAGPDGSGSTYRASQPGRGNPGGDGSAAQRPQNMNWVSGSGGGSTGNSPSWDLPGPGYNPPYWATSAIQLTTSFSSAWCGEGGSAYSNRRGPGAGGGNWAPPGQNKGANDGLVIVGYPFAELFAGGGK